MHINVMSLTMSNNLICYLYYVFSYAAYTMYLMYTKYSMYFTHLPNDVSYVFHAFTIVISFTIVKMSTQIGDATNFFPTPL